MKKALALRRKLPSICRCSVYAAPIMNSVDSRDR